MKRLLLCLAIPLCLGTSLASFADSLPDPLRARIVNSNTAREYILGANDTISVKIPNSPKDSFEAIKIQPDGNVILSLIGPIHLAGMSMTEAYETLNEKYKRYFRNSQVSVSLVQSKPMRVNISGAVIRPGSYEVATNVVSSPLIRNNVSSNEVDAIRWSPLLSSVVLASGGLASDANIETIEVTNEERHETFTINLMDLIDDTRPQSAQMKDIYLIQGDSIKVPHMTGLRPFNDPVYKLIARSSFSPRTFPVRVYGYVNSPGLVQLDSAQSLNLMSAITAAGGYSIREAYAPRKVYVSRPDATGKLTPYEVDPQKEDIALLPNDIVYVPQKTIPKIGMLFDFMARATQPLFFFSQSYARLAGRALFDHSITRP
jgi:polysaccharide biosynthesis/export protein